MNCTETERQNKRGGNFCSTTSQILTCLHHRELIFPALRLNWNHVLNTVPVDRNVDVVDLDLMIRITEVRNWPGKGVNRYSQGKYRSGGCGEPLPTRLARR